MSEQLYVALTPDGMYLKEYTASTHAGYRKYYEPTSLNAADALPAYFGEGLKHRHMRLLMFLA